MAKTKKYCIQRLFDPIKLTYWQTAIFKLTMIAIGSLFGMYFPEFFLQIEVLVWALAAAGTAVLWFFYFRGKLFADK